MSDRGFRARRDVARRALTSSHPHHRGPRTSNLLWLLALALHASFVAFSCGDPDDDLVLGPDGDATFDAHRDMQRSAAPPQTMPPDTRMSFKPDRFGEPLDLANMSILGDSPEDCRMACLDVFIDCVRDACGAEPSAQCFNQAAPICSSAVNECRRCCELPLTCH